MRQTLLRSFGWLFAGACGMTALLSLASAAGHDQLWFLLMARRWIDGASLYGPTAFDSNPPLIVWLSAVPVRLASVLPLPFADPFTAWAKLLVLLLLTAIALLCRTFLRELLHRFSRVEQLALLTAFVVIAGVVPARDFGQRDHLTGLLCLPYILAAAAWPSSNSAHNRFARPLTAVLAAAGVCLKPHQALIPCATELTVLLLWNLSGTKTSEDLRSASPETARSRPRTRLRTRLAPLARPEPWILLLAGAVFLVAVGCLTPAYFGVALPILRQTYWAIGHLTPTQLFFQSLQLHLLALAAVAGFSWQQHARRATHPTEKTADSLQAYNLTNNHNRPILLLLAAGCGATLAYYAQGTGWYYQQLPAITLFAAAFALELLGPLARVRSVPRSLPAIAAAVCILAVTLTAFALRDDLRVPGAFAFRSPDPTLFAELPSGTSIAILTTSVEDSMMPTARFHLTWAQRTNNLWLLPAILRLEDPASTSHRLSPAATAALDHMQHRWMVEDLSRWRPPLVLVERCQDSRVHCQELGDRHDDLLAWFARDPSFRRLWQSYRPARRAGDYDIWVLRDSALAAQP